MNITVFIIFGVIAVIMIVMAVFLLNGKGAFLVAGYNTMSKEEQSKYDEKALCRSVGWTLIAVTFGMLLIPAGIYLKISWLYYCGIALLFIIPITYVIYANTGNRFRKNNGTQIVVNNTNNKSTSNTRMNIIGISVISLIVLMAFGILIYSGEKDPVVNIYGNGIKINGQYGLIIYFNNITDIHLIEKSMRDIGIGIRTNGYDSSAGEALKGHFRSNALGNYMLFVQKNLNSRRV